MSEVFISYGGADRAKVLEFAGHLQRVGFKVWIDQEIATGARWNEEISRRLEVAKAVVVCWTGASVVSPWVMWEATNAQLQQKLVPVFLEDVSAPGPLGSVEGARLQSWKGEGGHPEWLGVLRALEQHSGRSGIASREAMRGELELRGRADGRHFVHGRETRLCRRILSLDAGGARTVFQLELLQRIEQILARRAPEPSAFRLSDYFDLIGGASYGGLVASLLAMGSTVAEVREAILQLGPATAQRDSLLFRPRHNTDLSKSLRSLLGLRTMGHQEWKTMVAICTKRLDTGVAWIATNNVSSRFWTGEDSQGTRDLRLADIVAASIADPRGMPLWISGLGGIFVDPRLSNLADPTVALLNMVLIPQYALVWEPDPDRLLIASVGSGMWRERISAKQAQSQLAALTTIRAAAGASMDSIRQNILLMQTLCDFRVAWPVGTEIGEMLPRTSKAHPLAYYRRFDLAFDPAELSRILGREIGGRELRQLRDPTDFSVAGMRRLSALGQQLALTDIVEEDFPPKFDVDLYLQEVGTSTSS